jgi:(p)ppGpp synthase/HD superfamily hydrolase
LRVFETEFAEVIAFATDAHEGQVRKYVETPYIEHPLRVAKLLFDLGMSYEVVAAAILHDTVEDCDTTADDIFERFGQVVADLVFWVTDEEYPVDAKPNRKIRQEIARDRLAKAPIDAKNIKLSDMYDNTLSIVADDRHFAKVYLPEKKAILTNMQDCHPVLLKMATDACEQGLRFLEQYNLVQALK